MKAYNHCCHQPLRRGAYIIGILEWVISFIQGAGCIYASYQTRSASFLGIPLMATIILIVALLNILFATLLLVGTHKKCHKLVLSWVVYYGIILSLGFTGQLVFSIVFLVLSFGISIFALTIVIPFLVIVVQFFLWKVIFSFYKELENEEREKNETPSKLTSINLSGP